LNAAMLCTHSARLYVKLLKRKLRYTHREALILVTFLLLQSLHE